jgi:hypothetical protein
MRQVGYVACMQETTGAYRVLVGNLRKSDHLKKPGIDGRIIKDRSSGHGMGRLGLRTQDHGNEISVSTKYREFLDQLRTS